MARPAGRPHDRNRQAAIVLGEKTYSGKRCKRCGSTTRYTKGSGCVACQKTSAIEARQLLRAARQKQNSGDGDLDFLGETHVVLTSKIKKTPAKRAQLTNSRSDPKSIEELVNGLESGETGTGAGTLSLSNDNSVATENGRFGEHDVSTAADPEPLCPQCGCNTEADFTQAESGGWLLRTSPWRCTICEWESPDPSPESLDNDDWLG